MNIEIYGGINYMKKPMVLLAGIAIFCIIIPVLISVLFYGNQNDNLSDSIKKIDKLEKSPYEKVDSKSPTISVYNSKTGKVQSMDIETFLYGVLSMEMSSEFSEEALKAQAVAARTYIIYKIENNIKMESINNYNHFKNLTITSITVVLSILLNINLTTKYLPYIKFLLSLGIYFLRLSSNLACCSALS